MCIKQVPDSREIRVDPKTNTLMRQGVPSVVNPYDLHAVEEAVRIKGRFPGTRVTALSMGPMMAVSAVKECVALGADEGVLISDRAFAGADTLATSYALAEGIRKAASLWGPVDLVLCGKQTIDGDTGQVGPGLAARLQFEQLTYVDAIDRLDPSERRIRVRRHLEDGAEVVETSLPAVLTVMETINKVHRASLPAVLRAVRYQPIVWTLKDFPEIDRGQIGLKGSPTVVGKAWVPEPIRRAGQRLEGQPPEAAAHALFELLDQRRLPEKLGWAPAAVAKG
ncbi:electron transfer flavoprotein subunit beta/FixA family protein [Carboxydochorda subterranea]|uniref:Electron transfer flavoprotein small subunit n=1 Tax=Carboxydichorda subterranea TaxID=3109565 RepID=A0ABZ1BW29_9FIRM|nr:electron transfer flavoprotein subunit beta/FixA family protein [Limnochorda sp. L945t]WRP16999.1 electron transfer flavoprotein subunit beta/FixA family protein [Limnochorda sp. L945t]